jgi:hypothetical protein
MRFHRRQYLTTPYKSWIPTMEITREKCKISLCGLIDLQFTQHGIKMNPEVPMVCKKKKKKKKKKSLQLNYIN